MNDLVKIDLDRKTRFALGSAATLATILSPVYVVGAVLIADEDREELRDYLSDGYKIVRWAYETAITGRFPSRERCMLD